MWQYFRRNLWEITLLQVLSGRNDLSETKLWHKTISPHSILIGHAVERGMARISDPTSTDRTTDHTMSYCTVFFRIHHRIVGGKKSQAMSFNNTRTVRGIYPEKIMILKIVSAREKF